MYPSQPVAPEGPRRAAGRPSPDQARMTNVSQPPNRSTRSASGSSQTPSKHNALASFVTYVKALEDLDRRAFPDEFARHADRIKELRPFLKAHGILDVMTIKNPEIAALVGI
ncbi:hypothetical protein [Nocardia sp. alder85J]|uniref:hypothetical protein n=1 Tax=Nocardia sp. alder85J TaxID=2862949 RepID=UPI001CD5BC10|nr:hypothetical protein [Nocardia sp. alder85J]MCX4095100.1 hypothetical protein [Nocardia sp. alder85J]